MGWNRIKQKLSECTVLNDKNVSRNFCLKCVCVCTGSKYKMYLLLWVMIKKKLKLRWYELQSRVFARRWKCVEDEMGSLSLSSLWPEPEPHGVQENRQWSRGGPTWVVRTCFRHANKGNHFSKVWKLQEPTLQNKVWSLQMVLFGGVGLSYNIQESYTINQMLSFWERLKL